MPSKRTSKNAASKRPTAKKWSKHVNETSNALALEANVFKSESAKKIASSLKASAEKSKRRKAGPFQ